MINCKIFSDELLTVFTLFSGKISDACNHCKDKVCRHHFTKHIDNEVYGMNYGKQILTMLEKEYTHEGYINE